MQDVQLYHQILGLSEPWRVKSVRLNREAGEVEIEVECTERVWGCPECGERMHVHDWERRRWRHLDSCQYRTILTAEVPRVKCPTHGTQMVKVPWAEKHGRFTALFERLAVDVMRECSVAAACEILRISWDEADGIKQRAVKRGLARRQPRVMGRLCVDEKSVGVGQQYMTIVAQVEEGRSARVEYVGEGRSRESLDAFWEQLSEEQRAGVEAVAMDMWEPFLRSTLQWVPGAAEKIVHDPFHLVQYMNDAVNQVRKVEHRRLSAQGDETLTGTRQLWLYGMENVPKKWEERFAEVKETSLQTARAWAIKEVFRSFWLSADENEARYRFDEWYSWAMRSRLGPVKKVARMCKRHLGNILTFFKHRLTNGPMEGLNNKIQGLIKKAFGYRNKERFKTDVLFHLGGLDLYPGQ
jgi:transposase